MLDGKYHPLYCRKNTGDLIYTDKELGIITMIGDIVTTEPFKVKEETVTKFLEENKGDLIGVVFLRGKSLIFLDMDTAELRPLRKLNKRSNEIFSIDLCI